MFVVEGLGLLRQAIDAGWSIEAVFRRSRNLGRRRSRRWRSKSWPPTSCHASPRPSRRNPCWRSWRCGPSSLPPDATFVLVADRVADPGNAGTIIRSAEAAGADGVVFTPGSVDPFNPKVVQGVGRLALPPPRRRGNARVVGRAFAGSAPRRIVATLYTDPVYHGRCAVVVGNEAHGLDDDAAIDQWITIPHAGPAESLNVAMAATVVAFEVARQRGIV